MAEKIPFFEFFESFVPPRELRLLLLGAKITGGVLDRENRTMELELETQEELPTAAQEALSQLLQQQYELRHIRLQSRVIKLEKGKSDNDDVLMGKPITKKAISMEGLNPKMGAVVVEGKVFACECYETRMPGKWCMTFDMTDYHNSVTVRKYGKLEEIDKAKKAIDKGLWVRVHGVVELTRDVRISRSTPITL